jgi:hypothetical protein
MADNSQKQIQDQIKLLEIQKNRIQANKTLSVQDKEQIKQIDALIKKEQVRLNRIKQTIKAREDEAKSFDSFAKSYRKLSNDVQKQLAGSSKQSGVYLSIGRAISKEVGIQTKYAFSTKASEKELAEKAAARQSKLTDISSELLNQAKATQKAEDNLRGVSDVDREILDIQESKGLYSAAQKAQMIAAIKQTEQLRLKEERLNTIAEERKNIFDALPGPIQDMVSGAKKFGNALKNGALPMVLLATVAIAALTSFTKLDESAKSFRETTGLTNSQMADIKSQANDITGQFATMGVDAEKVFNTVAGLKSEFSDIATFGDEVVAGLTLLNTNFGVSADSAAKVQGVFEQIGGLTSETAAGVQLQVANMAKLAGVAPAKIFEDIAENAEIASTLFQGDVESLATAAIEARRLGTNLKSVASTTEHLLDFQSNIGDELVAATFVGGQFNLTQARSLAAAGKSVEAQKEVLRQLQRGGDFRKKDYFTQQQLAKAAGMSVEEINKQLNAQEKLNSLSSEQRALAETAIQQGLDISNIDKEQLASQVEQFSKQQEMQSQVEQLKNAFMGVAASVGTFLTPLLETFGSVLIPLAQTIGPILSLALTPIKWAAAGLKTMVEYLTQSLPLMAALGAGAATYFYYKNQALIADKASAAWTLIKSGYEASYNAIVTAGNLIKKKGLLSAIAEMAMRAYTSIAAIPFVGPVLGVAAAAGAIALGYQYYNKAGDVMSPADGKTRISTKEGGLLELSPNDDVVAAPGIASTLANSGGGVGINMDAVVNELKALKEEFRKTKDVYMDGRKVTSNVGRTVDSSSKNNFSFGT